MDQLNENDQKLIHYPGQTIIRIILCMRRGNGNKVREDGGFRPTLVARMRYYYQKFIDEVLAPSVCI